MKSSNYSRPCSNHITIDYSCDVTIAMDSAKGINNPKGYTVFGLSHTSHFCLKESLGQGGRSWLNVSNSVIGVP